MTTIKDRLPHGQFLPWIAAEFEMTARTAQSFMDVFDRFGKNEKISFFKPSVLYALAAPSTPDTVIDKAVAKAESGEKVTVADVKDWKAELDAERQARGIGQKRLPKIRKTPRRPMRHKGTCAPQKTGPDSPS